MRLIGLKQLLIVITLCTIGSSISIMKAAAQPLGAGVLRVDPTSRPNVTVSLVGSIQRGADYVALDKAGDVKPGELIRWAIEAHNIGGSAAFSYSTSAKVPAGTVFVATSAGGDASPTVTYSVDGGREFSADPKVVVKHSDGTTSLVSAPVSAYTNVRFTWTQPINAGDTRSAHYDVRVK